MNSQDYLSAPPQATPLKPWLGLAHYGPADSDYFFGREQETQALTEHVRYAPLTVLYGVSGDGKSSLIGAGLIPELIRHGYRIVIMRRCYDDLDKRPLTEDVIREAGGDPASAATLWEFFHTRSAAPQGEGSPALPLVLIFDQFEEIFTKGEDMLLQVPKQTSNASEQPEQQDQLRRAKQAADYARQFLTQLADLVENRPPAALRERLATPGAEQQDLLAQYDFQSAPVRVLLSLREDFLSRLERERRAMPSLMQHRMELQKLRGDKAFEAVFHPGTRREGLPPIIPWDVAELIVRAAADVPANVPLDEIDAVPSILSLFCERKNAGRKAESISANDFTSDEAKRILSEFFDEKTRGQPRLRAVLEDRLATADGRRNTDSRPRLLEHLRGVSDAEAKLNRLVDDRVLVIEERAGITRVEFTHDKLAEVAAQSRARRQRERLIRMMLVGGIVAAVVITGLAALVITSLRMKNRAELAESRLSDQVKEQVETISKLKTTETKLQAKILELKGANEKIYEFERAQKEMDSTKARQDEYYRLRQAELATQKQTATQLAARSDSLARFVQEKLMIALPTDQQIDASNAVVSSIEHLNIHDMTEAELVTAWRAYSTRSALLLSAGKMKDAENDAVRAVEFSKRRLSFVDTDDARREHAGLVSDAGWANLLNGDYKLAADRFHEAEATMVTLVAKEPKNFGFVNVLAIAQQRLGVAFVRTNGFTDAEAANQRFVATRKRSSELFPELGDGIVYHAFAIIDLADFYLNWTENLKSRGQTKEAEAKVNQAEDAIHEADKLLKPLLSRQDVTLFWKHAYALNLHRLVQREHYHGSPTAFTHAQELIQLELETTSKESVASVRQTRLYDLANAYDLAARIAGESQPPNVPEMRKALEGATSTLDAITDLNDVGKAVLAFVLFRTVESYFNSEPVDYPKVIATAQRARQLYEALYAANSSNGDYKVQMAIAICYAADSALRLNTVSSADELSAFREANRILLDVIEKHDPEKKRTDWLWELALSYQRAGYAASLIPGERTEAQWDEIQQAYDHHNSVLRDLIERFDPSGKNDLWTFQLAKGFGFSGLNHSGRGNNAAAINDFREFKKLVFPLYERNPANAFYAIEGNHSVLFLGRELNKLPATDPDRLKVEKQEGIPAALIKQGLEIAKKLPAEYQGDIPGLEKELQQMETASGK